MDVNAQSSGDRDGGVDYSFTDVRVPLLNSPTSQIASKGDQPSEPNNTQHGAVDLSSSIPNPGDKDLEPIKAHTDMEELVDYGTPMSIYASDIRELQTSLPKIPPARGIPETNDKLARVTGLYVHSLEARVGKLENHVEELEVILGQRKKKPDFKEGLLSLNGPYHPSHALEAVRLSMKEFRENSPMIVNNLDPYVLLGFTSSPGSLQNESIYHHPLDTLQNRQGIAHVESDGSVAGTAEEAQPRETDLARIMFNSHWFYIVIELLTGQYIDPNRDFDWIYPFKYPIAYFEHIRKFIQLLDEVELSSNVDDMLPTLTQVAEKTATCLGLNRSDFTYSNEYTARVLKKAGHALSKHFQKLDKSSQASKEKKNLIGHTNRPHLPRNASWTDQSNKEPSTTAEHEPFELTCTCLGDARDHLRLLCNVIDEYLPKLLLLQRAISDRSLKKIRFQDLWFLYKPGDLIITSKQPHQAYRVIHVCGGRPLTTKSTLRLASSGFHQDQNRKSNVSAFKIDCVRFDFDGENFGPLQTTIDITEFHEERNITDLVVYPIDFAEHKTALRTTLLARGQRFASFRDYKHQKYVGLSLGDTQEEIESEVIIDFARAFRQHPYSQNRPQLGLRGKSSSDYREIYEDRCRGEKCTFADHNRILDDTVLDDSLTERFVNAETDGLLLENAYREKALNEDQLILLSCCVHGFSLRSRNWVSLDIESLSDIKVNDALDPQNTAFEDLVIPQEYKKTVKALVKTHTLGSENSHQVDLVRGKGKGLIILLHGVPGVGKTSTAECVAAYTKRPLFPITCGDIGQTAQEVEKNLEDIFLLARSWGCVLLLDEADVFLAKRQVDSVERNALVSVFLRTLEYYSGILFLTTNRIGSFDEAFISRIHISLYYPDLDEKSTLQVWHMNLGRIERSGRNIYVKNDEIKAFANSHWEDGHRWNGRQIRNAFQTAMALAEYDFYEDCNMCEKTGRTLPKMPVLESKHFSVVAKTYAEFDDYLRNVFDGSSHKDKAKMAEIRSDNWQDQGTETPTGKKYSTERAKRPGTSVVHEVARQRSGQVVPKTSVQKEPVRTDLSEGGIKNVGDDEEFRMWREEKQRKEREKIQRFEMMEKDMEEGQ